LVRPEHSETSGSGPPAALPCYLPITALTRPEALRRQQQKHMASLAPRAYAIATLNPRVEIERLAFSAGKGDFYGKMLEWFGFDHPGPGCIDR